MHRMRLPESVPGGIEVYRLDLDLNRPAEHDWPALTADECQRARRFARAADRVRFSATRAAVRGLLARRLCCAPAAVPLAQCAHGKPRVALDAAHAPCFNVSHAGAHALIAIADAQCARDIGIDIEQWRAGMATEDVFALAFTARERLALRRAADRPHAFYTRWTGKEAVLKAIGVGVPDHLQRIGVHPEGERLAVECSDARWTRFKAVTLAAPSGYSAALAWRTKEFFS